MVSLEQLQIVDEVAADAVANLRASIDSQSTGNKTLAAPGLRGLVVGRLNMHADGDDNRHLFVEAALGIQGGSCKTLTHAQGTALLWWLDDGGANLVPAIVNAARIAAGQLELPGTETKGEEKMAEGEVHWTKDGEKVAKFWAWTVENGLSAPDVTKALGVADIANYEGEKVDALHACQALIKAAEQRAIVGNLATTDREHGEAAVIAFTKTAVYTPSGVEVSITARQGATAQDVAATALALVGGIETLTELGWKTEPTERVRYIPQPSIQPPPVKGQGPLPRGAQPPPTPPSTPDTVGPPAPPQPMIAGPPQGEQIMEAVKITVDLSKSRRPQVAFWGDGRQYADLWWSFGGAKLLEVSPSLVLQGWTAEHFDAVGAEYAIACHVFYTLSEKLTSKGKPYKDITRVEVD